MSSVGRALGGVVGVGVCLRCWRSCVGLGVYGVVGGVVGCCGVGGVGAFVRLAECCCGWAPFSPSCRAVLASVAFQRLRVLVGFAVMGCGIVRVALSVLPSWLLHG